MASTEPFNVVDSQESRIQRIMLVADGEPQHGGLAPLSYSSQRRALLGGFFSSQREQIIQEAHEKSNQCQSGTKTYVMTTGHGAMPVAESPLLYNVPGELSINLDEYKTKYRMSFLNMLPLQNSVITTVTVVYYAGMSQKPFRNGVFHILADLGVNLEVSSKIHLHACMFGASKHVTDRWRYLCDIYSALINNKTSQLGDLQSRWLQRYDSVFAFFEWF